MQIFLVFSLIIAFLAILFAVQNNQPATIRFVVWQYQGSLALILFIALAVGALISFLASTPSRIKGRMESSSQKKKIAELEASLAEHKARLEETNPSEAPEKKNI